MSIQGSVNSMLGSATSAMWMLKDMKFKKEAQDFMKAKKTYDKTSDEMLKAQEEYGKTLDESEAEFAKTHPDYKIPNGDYKPAGADNDGYVDFAADLNNYINRGFEDGLKKRQAEVNLSNEAMKAYRTIYGNRGDSF